MEVQAVEAGSLNLDSFVRPGDLPKATNVLSSLIAAGEMHEDTVAALLQQLAGAQIQELLSSIEQRRLSPDPILVERLLQAAGSAVLQHDTARALATLTELLAMSPERAGTLLYEPSLTAIRGDVKELLQRFTRSARADAEEVLTAASRAIETSTAGRVRAAEANPHVVLAVAERFFESGQFVNYVRASELGQVVLGYFAAPAVRPFIWNRDARTDAQAAMVRLQRQTVERLRILWQRVPLLVLLTVWLTLGFVGGVLSLASRQTGQGPWNPAGFEIWGVGFLALVGLQFYLSIRNARF